MMQAGVYGVVVQYLKAVHALGGTAKGAVAVRQMKAMLADDAAFGHGSIRADGRGIQDNFVFQIKSPAESKGPWDCYKLVRTVPGETAFRPMAQGGCPLLAEMTKG